jgi:chitinase
VRLRAGLLCAAVLGTGLLPIFPGSGRAEPSLHGKLRLLSIQDVAVQEGAGGTTAASFRVSLSGPSLQTVKVHYATVDATATSPDDYQTATGTFQIKAGKTTGTVTVLVNGDTTPEPDEQFLVKLSAAVNASIADDTATGTITNDDPPPTLAIGNATVTEGDSGTVNAVFAVTLSAASASTVTVDYSSMDGSAAAPGDYASTSGALTFNPGETAKQIVVAVDGDTAVETDETFTVVLSNPANATIAGSGIGTGTITNDDAGSGSGSDLPTVSIGDSSVTEGNLGFTVAMFTVTLSAPSAQQVSVDYETADGSATAPGDYGPSTDTIVIAPGDTTANIAILVNGDGLSEGDETFFLNLSAPVNASILDGHGLGTITNDDALPTVAIGNATANEGNSGTTSFTFTVSLSAESGQTVAVNYASSDGTATQPGDYQAASGTLTFSPGQTSKTVNVLVNGDTAVETNETFRVVLSDPTNASIFGSGIGTGTITDDDAPTVSIANATVTEGNSGTVNAVFAVTLSAASASTVTVDYSTFDGSAAAPADYAATSATLTFAPGQTAKQIIVPVSGDTAVETTETFTVVLANPANATISGSGIATGTITNDDSLPTLTIVERTVTEGNSGTVNAAFAVTLSAVSASTVTVDYATFDGSAVAPGDYAATSGTLTFTPGQTAKQIVVLVNGDTTVETNETFTVNLSNPTNATIVGTGVVSGTITNDDALPTLTVGNVTASEGNSGTTSFSFAVTLSAASGVPVTVDFATADSSAVAPGDYATTSGTLTFSPGQTAKQIVVAVNGDTTIEGTETFTVNLSNPANAIVSGSGIATGTITNDDALPTLTVGNVTANEGNSGTTSFTFVVTLSAVSASTVTVDYSTFDGSAAASGDYAATSGTLTFAPGQTAKQIVVAVNGDTTVEANETFTVNLSNPTNASISGSGVATGTITNDDALPTLAIAAATVTEGNSGTVNAVFAVTLSAASASTVTVDYSTFDGSAAAPGD